MPLDSSPGQTRMRVGTLARSSTLIDFQLVEIFMRVDESSRTCMVIISSEFSCNSCSCLTGA